MIIKKEIRDDYEFSTSALMERLSLRSSWTKAILSRIQTYAQMLLIQLTTSTRVGKSIYAAIEKIIEDFIGPINGE